MGYWYIHWWLRSCCWYVCRFCQNCPYFHEVYTPEHAFVFFQFSCTQATVAQLPPLLLLLFRSYVLLLKFFLHKIVSPHMNLSCLLLNDLMLQIFACILLLIFDKWASWWSIWASLDLFASQFSSPYLTFGLFLCFWKNIYFLILSFCGILIFLLRMSLTLSLLCFPPIFKQDHGN